MKVKKSKKYMDGGPLQPKPKKKAASKDSVDSEMFPGKKVAIKDVRRGPYVTEKKKTVVKKKMKDGGSLKPVDAGKNPGLSKLPKPVRNKMGYQKDGGKSKAKAGVSVKKKAMGGAKMMKDGGKCKYGC